jgi:outer membrane protein assembly factor BamA
MRGKLTHICILTAASLCAIQQSSYAQQIEPCPTSHTQDDEPTGPEISIAEVTFSGSLQMPLSDQSEIATSIKDRTHGTSLDLVTEEALERARGGWQDRGYFKAEIAGEARIITSNPASQRIGLSIHVDEGVQYTLSKITFKNNKAIKSVELLRGLFPITDGDILSRDKIATGLENLRKAYGELGYINFTSIPDNTFDDQNKAVSIAVDLDEGQQFYLSSVNVLGLDEAAKQQLLSEYPLKQGQVFSSRLWERALLKYDSMYPDCPCRAYEPRHLDEHSATVAVTLDFRPCTD